MATLLKYYPLLFSLATPAAAFSSLPGESLRPSVLASSTLNQQVVDAVKRMKSTPSRWSADPSVPKRWHGLSWYDTLVTIHVSQYNENAFAHMGPAFLPWHRVFLELLEEGMNAVMQNPSPKIVQPFWDWTKPAATATLFQSSDGGIGGDGYGDCVKTGPYAWPAWNITVTTHGPLTPCLKRQFATMGAQYVRVQDSNLPNAAEVDKALLVFRYDSWPFDVGSWGAVSFRNVMEGWATVTNEGAATGTTGRGLHNLVHIWTGGTMGDTGSPNDPAFWYHHANVDRLFESWLQSSGALYGHGRTVVKIDKAGSTYVAKGYPATIMKLYDDGCRSAYPNLSARLTYDASRGMRITFNQTQTESDFVVSEFVMKCGTDQYGKIGKLALGSANSMRLIIGWNESSNWAGTIPPLSETYVDPLVFRSTPAHLPQPLVYESFSLGGAGAGQVSGILVPLPFTYDRQTQIYLSQPDWFKSSTLSDAACMPVSAWAGKEQACTRLNALAVNGCGDQCCTQDEPLDMSGYNAAHYYMPGYFEQLKTFPLVLNVNCTYVIPKTTCTAVPDALAGDKPLEECVASSVTDEQGEYPPDYHAVEFDEPRIQFEAYTCYNSSETLKAAGFVKPNAAAPEGKWCVVNFFVLGEVSLQRFSGASTFIAPELLPARTTPLPLEGLDVLDQLFVGARPGHNEGDKMPPFHELGYDRSPADYFEPQKRYTELYEP